MRTDPEPAIASLATEGTNPATRDIDRMDPLEMVRVMNQEDAAVAGAVETQLPQITRAVEGIASRMRRGGRLIYIGAGTSGRLGVLDASECPPTFNTPPDLVIGLIAGGERALTRAVEEVEDRPEAGRIDLEEAGVSEADTVVGLAASGRTPYVLGALRFAGEQGALTVGVTCNEGTPMDNLVDVLIAPIVGPEVITGSTRLKAGTAQKMVLNMLSTGTMILLGKTFGNLMVDLRPTNTKLRERSIRMLQSITGLDPTEATAQLHEANGEVKTAIVAALAGVGPAEARERLAAAGGVIRQALEGVGP